MRRFDLHHGIGCPDNAATTRTCHAIAQGDLYTGTNAPTSTNASVYSSTQATDSRLHAANRGAICCSDRSSTGTTACTTKAAGGVLCTSNHARTGGAAAADGELCAEYSKAGHDAYSTAAASGEGLLYAASSSSAGQSGAVG